VYDERRNSPRTINGTPASQTRIYWIWAQMKQRCANPHKPAYRLYGARGIQVCERWMNFWNFYTDMGDRPKGMTLDRIDNQGNYEPSNCKWSTYSEQLSNRRRWSKKGYAHV
jgi:hypothetical protein